LKRIYVGNLPYRTTEEALEGLFSPHGSVGSVALIRDRETGQSRGFGFVEMPDDQEAAAAIEALHGSTFEGRTLTVNEAQPRTPHPRGGSRSGRDDRTAGSRYSTW
jgi:RNA recognition motif-containing protein